MILTCPGCRRRYRLSDDLAAREGVRFRCSGCGMVFSRPESGERDGIFDMPVDQGREEDFREIAKLLDDIGRGSEREESSDADDDAVSPDPGAGEAMAPGPADEGARASSFGIWGVLLVLMVLVIAATAVVSATNPSLRSSFTAGFVRALSSVESWIGARDDGDHAARARSNIELEDVRESLHANWIAGNILLVEGTALNSNEFSLSSIRVRGKLMDSGRNVVALAEAYCGNLLSDEELRNLTEREIERELLMPAGRDRRGIVIPPDGPVPFMLAFVNPPEGAGRFAVEVVAVMPAGK